MSCKIRPAVAVASFQAASLLGYFADVIDLMLVTIDLEKIARHLQPRCFQSSVF